MSVTYQAKTVCVLGLVSARAYPCASRKLHQLRSWPGSAPCRQIYQDRFRITTASTASAIHPTGAPTMSGTYQHELRAACEAVRLAARLCTVYCTRPCVLISISLQLKILWLILQKVQLQLKAGEKQDKSDDSPVTIADYGE